MGPASGRSGAAGEGLGHSEGAAEGAEVGTGARLAAEGGNENGVATGLGPIPYSGGPSLHGGAPELHTLSPFASHVPSGPEVDGSSEAGDGCGRGRGGTPGRHTGGRDRGSARCATTQDASNSTAPGVLQGPPPRFGSRPQGTAPRRRAGEAAALHKDSTAENPALTSAGGWASDEEVSFCTLAIAAAACEHCAIIF